MEVKSSPLRSISRFFGEFGEAVVHGDAWTKLTLLWMGAGYFGRKQYMKALLMTLFQIAVLAFTFGFAAKYIVDFGTLGTVQMESVFNIETMQNEYNAYDNSFLILLYSVISIVVWVGFALSWIFNVKCVYRLQKRAEQGRHINVFREDLREYLNGRFYVTLLSLPVSGVVIFTIVPLIIMIFVAFTNYDQNHMPPAALFDWVGLDNFANLIGGEGLSISFSYAFWRILGWTLLWSFFATLTCYFGGILLSLFINSKQVMNKKLWRSLFMVAIAVPQFVSLLLVRNFFADNGIMNTILHNIGVTGLLQNLGLISHDYIPFLTSPGWAHVMVILINIWVGVPYQMLIATGVLMNLPHDQIESASLDGASRWQVFRHITMPYVFNVTGPALISDFVRNINNFNVIYLLTANVYTTTDQIMANSQAKEVDLLVTWLFTLTQENYNYKMASVLGIVIFVVCAVFTLICFRRLNRKEGEFA